MPRRVNWELTPKGYALLESMGIYTPEKKPDPLADIDDEMLLGWLLAENHEIRNGRRDLIEVYEQHRRAVLERMGK